MIKILVSDLGKVLLPFDTEPCWRRLLPRCAVGEAEARARFGALLAETGFGSGRVTGEEFHARLGDALGLELDYEAFCEAWSDMFWEDREVIALVHGAPVAERYLLSNTNVIHWDWIQRHYPHVLQGFDRLIVSHECGAEKPDPAIFEHVMALSGRPPEAHLFIDDIPAYVEGARRLGFDGIVHTDATALRAAFVERGLVG
jgi:putative hydrolase of the HAD superfamily